MSTITPSTDPEELLRQLLEHVGPQLYTPEQAAKRLGKGPEWVRDAIREGRIPHTRVGKSPRLTAEHIRQIAAAGEVPVGRRRAA